MFHLIAWSKRGAVCFGGGTEGEAECWENMVWLFSAIKVLSPVQRELVEKVYFEERKITDIAREEGVSLVAIPDRLEWIYKKYK